MLVSFNLITFGQNQITDTSTTIVAYWDEGDNRILEVEQAYEYYVNNELKKEKRTTYEAHVKVINETDKSYTIEWTNKNIQTSEDENPITKNIVKITEGLKMTYKTDELGVFIGLVNWEEIRDYLNDILDKRLKESNNDPQVATVSNQIRSIYQTKESIEQTAIKDIQLFHSPYGGEFILNEKLTFETQLPNVLGGEPFPANMTIELTDLKPKEDYCKLTISQQIDKKKGSALIYDFLKRMTNAMGNSMPIDQDLPAFEITDNNEFKVELITGWLTRAYSKRLTENDIVRQTEIHEITLAK